MKQIIAFILTIIGGVALGLDFEIGTLKWFISIIISQVIILPAFLYWIDYLKKSNTNP